MDIFDRIVAIAVPWDVILPYLIPDNSSVSGSFSYISKNGPLNEARVEL